MFRRVIKWIFKVILIFFSISIGFVLLYKFVNPPITSFMISKYFSGEGTLIQKDWVSLDHISAELPLAVIAAEDQKFLEHNGFDLDAIEKAIQDNSKGKRIKGGSTISQQTAKNVFLVPNRSWVRKGLETYFTFLIEVFWSKRRIMEVYLNVLEQGDGVYGVQASAVLNFNRDAKAVSRSQAALMAVVLPNPVRYKIASPTNYIRNRQAWVVRQMRNLGGTSFVKSLYEE